MLDLSHLNERGFWDVAALSDAPLVVTHTAAHALCASSRNLTDKQIDAVGESGGVIGVIFFVGNLRADGRQEADTPIAEIVRHVDYIAGADWDRSRGVWVGLRWRDRCRRSWGTLRACRGWSRRCERRGMTRRRCGR